MFRMFWRNWGRAVFWGAALLVGTNLAQAQTVPPPSLEAPRASLVPAGTNGPSADEMKAQLDRQQKQIQELIETIRGMQARMQPVPIATPVATEGGGLGKEDVQKIVGDYLSQKDAQSKAADAARKAEQQARGYTVGNNLGMSGSWKPGMWSESPDHAFKFHVGGRAQFDVVSPMAGNAVQFGPGGIGEDDSAVNFRRARLDVEGTFWETFDFHVQFDFVNTTQALSATGLTGASPNLKINAINTTFNTPVPTDLWIQMTQIPWLGNFRVGNQKPLIGFEHMTSSKYLNFMERSSGFDSFFEDGNNGFEPGFSVFNNWGPDQNGMWGAGLYKTNRTIFGWNVGNGEWQGNARGTWLPVYQDHGRYLLHLGMGAEYRDLDQSIVNNQAESDSGNVRFRTRQLLRNGPASLHNIVAIAQLNGNSQMILNPELVMNIGPFTLQSEYTRSYVYGVDRIIRTPTQTNVTIPVRTYNSQAFYVEALYFLTGEHRLYDKKMGAFGRVVPNRNFYFVQGEDGKRLFSSGAWQVGLRYGYLDLDDGPVRGGQLNDVTLGLNWFLNPNFKIQWNVTDGYRTVSATPTPAFPNGSNGNYWGLGMRFAFDW